MGRPGKAVIVYDGKEKLKFSSLNKVAEYYDVPYISLYHCMRRGSRYKPLNLTFEYASEDDTMPLATPKKAPKEEKSVPHYEVEIEGKIFVSHDGSQEKNCTTCGIYKLKPPTHMTQYPLCFEYSCRKHKIYELCGSHHLTWKEKK